MKKYFIIIAILFLFIMSAITAYAHSGKTDANGGHYDGDEYHYHHGYRAHQHPGGVCPYDYDDNVDYDKKEDSDSNNDFAIYATVFTVAAIGVTAALTYYIKHKNKKDH